MPFALGNAAAALGKKTLVGLIEEKIDEIMKVKPGEVYEIKDTLNKRTIVITTAPRPTT